MKKFTDFFSSGITAIGYLRKYKIKKGDVVIDAGAYLGFFTILAAKLVGKNGKVIAFEASPSNFNILKQRVNKLGLTNIILINKALFNKKGRVFFSNDVTSSSSLKERAQNKYALQVESTTLDYELFKKGIKKVDFIKMDIEGSEIEALKGGKNTLSQTNNLAIACYHIRNNTTTGKILTPLLENTGFKTSIGFILHPTLYGSKQ